MRRQGLLHAELNRLIAALGHTDSIVIADVGLPVPHGVPCIDLALVAGVPSFADTFEAVFRELAVERVVMASEIHQYNPAMAALALRLQSEHVGVSEVTHEALKLACADARAIIRTGETSPYANVILYAGVTF